MMGSNHKSALLVMTDRTTLVTMIEKLESKNADEINSKMVKRLTLSRQRNRREPYRCYPKVLPKENRP